MDSRTINVQEGVQRSRQLDFTKAMSDFKVMFPTFDYEVIEMVLRANNGLVDATVDQLLAMQGEANEPEENGLLDPELNVRLPSYSDTSASNFEPPPAYTPRVEEDPNFSYDSTFLEPHLSNFNTSVPHQNTTTPRKTTSEWQPPLLGTLPNDFLRINLDDDRPSSSVGICSENPLYGVNPIPTREPVRAYNGRFEPAHRSQDARPNTSDTAVSRSTVNGFDHGLDAVPNQGDEAKSCGKKGKSKKFGQMSRKFRRKKTKSSKGTTYQQMSGTNLIDEESGDERDAQR